eukprot:g19714.t1
MAVGRALLLHLELATVPLLVAALCSCAPMTPVATLRRPLGTSSAPISAAQAAAVVATVFLADRAAERLLVKRWWVATLGNLLAALLCLNFPEARRPRLSEWAGNYANLRAASSSAAMAAGAARQSCSQSTLASSRVASAADLVGGLRRLSARLLKPPLQEQEEAHDPSFWNCLLAELWPSLRGMIEEDILKGEVQSVTSTNRPLSCVLQLGAASYRSAKSESEDGDFLWDEEPFLVVDHFEQSLLLALHERHTFNDRAIAHQAISIKELIDRSRWQHMPSWSLQAMGSETTTPQLLFSSSFHELSRKRASFAGLGSLLLLTVDCARHVPPELDGALLMLRWRLGTPGG